MSNEILTVDLLAAAHNHNRRVAWIRMWGAVGVQHLADSQPTNQVAKELAAFEARRYATACYSLGTTKGE